MTLHLQHIQLEGKKHYDEKYNICHEELVRNNIVLLHNTRRKKEMSCKLAFKWLGLSQISNTIKDKDTYILEELDRL